MKNIYNSMTRDLIIDNYLNECDNNKHIIREIIHNCIDIFDNQYNN
jgi:hypothetical protein